MKKIFITNSKGHQEEKRTLEEVNGIPYRVGEVDKKGRLQGEWKYYDNEGALITLIRFKDNKWNGMRYDFHDNGELEFKGYFIDDKEEGLHRWNYENGNPRQEFIYENGKRDGEQRYYREDGTLRKTLYFIDGFNVTKEEWEQEKKRREEGRIKALERMGII